MSRTNQHLTQRLTAFYESDSAVRPGKYHGDWRLNIDSGISIPASHAHDTSRPQYRWRLLQTLRVTRHTVRRAPHRLLAALEVTAMQSWRLSGTPFQSLRPFHAISPPAWRRAMHPYGIRVPPNFTTTACIWYVAWCRSIRNRNGVMTGLAMHPACKQRHWVTLTKRYVQEWDRTSLIEVYVRKNHLQSSISHYRRLQLQLIPCSVDGQPERYPLALHRVQCLLSNYCGFIRISRPWDSFSPQILFLPPQRSYLIACR